MNHYSPPRINKKTYAWSVRAFSTVKRMLGVNIRLHAPDNQVETGDIFLFNHFSRFETFIPQYLIYQEQKAYCRSVAASEFFTGDPRFTHYLHSVGAVPNNLPDLLPFLARDIFRGRKVIIFPEGGMVKDRKVVSDDGDFSIYSPTSDCRRKHHTGAARLALALDIFKSSILHAEQTHNFKILEKWTADLGLDEIEDLLVKAHKPTQIVPSNITFYPIRISTNFLKDTVERLSGNLAPKYKEELLIEGNLVLKDTDMDIRMGAPVTSDKLWTWFDKMTVRKSLGPLCSLDEILAQTDGSMRFIKRLGAQRIVKKTKLLRDDAMAGMYRLVTLNLSHLASVLILKLIDQGLREISKEAFLEMLYLATKSLQNQEGIHLHTSLRNLEKIHAIRDGDIEEIRQFLRSAQTARVIDVSDHDIHFLNKLCSDHDFQTIRMENPICVYANECESLPEINQAVDQAITSHQTFNNQDWLTSLIEDEENAFAQDLHDFSSTKYYEINRQQTATQSGAPYFLSPAGEAKQTGVLLVHGFLASPFEMRLLGNELRDLGHKVYGVRLKGHGTSPCDLRDRSWQDWMRSLHRGYEILSHACERIAIVGFSTGGALSLLYGAERPEKLAGICAISTPLRFANPNLKFIPLIHHANRLAKWLAAQEGVLPYIMNESEHPDINYRHIPVRALHELRQLVHEMEANLYRINAPCRLIQGDNEKVVQAESAGLIRDQMVATTPEVVMIPSKRHGIVHEDIAGTRKVIANFIEGLEDHD